MTNWENKATTQLLWQAEVYMCVCIESYLLLFLFSIIFMRVVLLALMTMTEMKYVMSHEKERYEKKSWDTMMIQNDKLQTI